MKISRLDLDGIGSPTRLAERIHEIEDLPMAVPLEELCRALDIETIEDSDSKAFEAALVTDSLKSSGHVILSRHSPWHRRRFSLAHELGHFLIEAHRPREGSSMECSISDLFLLNPRDRDRRRRIEGEANRFAAHLLMPPKRIRTYVGGKGTSLETIVAMARDMRVSKEAMARAFVEAHHEPVAIIVSRCGVLERTYRGQDFPFIPLSKGNPLPTGSISIDPIEAGQFTEAEELEADEWLAEREAKRVLALTEQVLGQAEGYALTLLQAELDDQE